VSDQNIPTIAGGSRPRRILTFGLLASLCLSACSPPGIKPIVASGHGSTAQLATEKGPHHNVPPYAFDTAEEAGVDQHCIAHIMAANLLTRNGSPAIEMSINDAHGAAYLSPAQGILGVFDSREIELPMQDSIEMETVSQHVTTYFTKADHIQIAQGFASDVDAIKLGWVGRDRVAGEIPVGILGFDVLGNYDVLLDMPRQRVMFFRPSGAPDCPPLSAWMKDAYQTPLLMAANGQDDLAAVFLNGHPVGMELEPGSDVSIIRRADAEAAGVDKAGLGNDDSVRTKSSSVMLGARHRFATVTIGNWHGHDFDVNIEPALFSLLGLKFFRHRKVLMAFPQGMLFFSDEHADLLPPDTTRAEPSPISSRLAITHVNEPPPPTVVTPPAPAAPAPPSPPAASHS
jgi:hypothetical protein